MIAGSDYLSRREGVLAQEAHGETVLLRLADGSYYTVGEVAGRVWELCDGARTVDEVVSVVCAEFDGPPDVVRGDVLAFLEDLVGEGLLDRPD